MYVQCANTTIGERNLETENELLQNAMSEFTSITGTIS